MNNPQKCKLCCKPAVVLHQQAAYCARCYIDKEGILTALKLPSGEMAEFLSLRDKPKPQVVRRKLYD